MSSVTMKYPTGETFTEFKGKDNTLTGRDVEVEQDGNDVLVTITNERGSIALRFNMHEAQYVLAELEKLFRQ